MPRVASLSPAQLSVLRSIHNMTEELGQPPTLQELCKELGFASTNAVSVVQDKLRERRLINRKYFVPRSVRLTEAGYIALREYEKLPALRMGKRRLTPVPGSLPAAAIP